MNDESSSKTTVANEFAMVTVDKVQTRNGERLEIASPRLGFRIQLDAMELESLSWQRKDVFSQFLNTPYGPGH
uniref:Orf72 protein n=1 Tax=Nocardioides sp. (strain KP7) TaxID=102632 RepID=Q9LC85_NOCSK|nr:orf72 [Nocardioides sp. KP7]